MLFSHEPEYIAETLDRWLAYYDRIGADALGYGAIVLRRRSGGPNWMRAEQLTVSRAGIAGEHVARLFAAQDLLRGAGLAGGDPRRAAVVVEPHTLVRALRAGATARGRRSTRSCRSTTGLGFQGSVDPPTIRLLPLLDGQRTVRDALGEVADSVGMGDPPEHRAAFVDAGVPIVTRLFSLGFLVPAPD